MTATARRRPGNRIDPVAAGWGGLAGAVGLMVGSPREIAERLVIVAVGGVAAGFLAGVRAIGRRIAHSVAAWGVAVLLLLAFVVVTALADVLGARSGLQLAPDGWGHTVIALLVGAGGALLGGAVANRWLRPASRGR